MVEEAQIQELPAGQSDTRLATDQEIARNELLTILEKMGRNHDAFLRKHEEERKAMAYTYQECDIRTPAGHLLGSDIRDVGVIPLQLFIRATKRGNDRFKALYQTHEYLVRADKRMAKREGKDPKTDFKLRYHQALLNEVRTKALPRSQIFQPKPKI